METHQDPRLGIGGNLPPTDAEILKSTLAESNKEIIDRVQALVDAAERAPNSITDDETKEKITDFLGSIAKCEKALEGKRVSEKRTIS